MTDADSDSVEIRRSRPEDFDEDVLMMALLLDRSLSESG
jgi:hypothetical protein